MARKSRNEPKGKASRGKSKPARRAAPAADVVEIEEVKAGGLGVDEGIIIGTTLILAVACFLMFNAMQTYTA